MRQVTGFLLAVLLAAAPAFAADAMDMTPLRGLPVLDHGRVKPIDTVARETVESVTGCEKFGLVTVGSDGLQTHETRDPLELAMDWAAHPNAWQTRPVLWVPLLDLRNKLQMKPTDEWISARAVMENTDFTAWVHGIEDARAQAEQNQETIFHSDPIEARLEDAAIELDTKLKLFESATDLSLYPILPVDPSKPAEPWLPISQIMTLTGQDADVAKPIQTAWSSLLDSYKNSDSIAFASAAGQLGISLREIVGMDYFDPARINREVFYNELKPFRWAWVLYLLAVASLIGALISHKKATYIMAMSIFAAAILFHAAAFTLRCTITGWAPVTNMYETVIWVAMMGAIFSYVLELIYRKRTIAVGGAVVALLAAVVADNMPPEYGHNIRNLTPVLRSNYWLVIHVLTIVSSYAAFALAMVLGNIVLGQYIHGKSNPTVVRENLLFTYRAVQIGVLLIAAGTILGGLWADVSWGKFWSWDPKEVWALVVLLTYLALLHGRFAGWIGPFGMAAGAVICFSAVVMSWYGVNFVLGAGLHSYGFNTGGQGYVFTGVAIQWAYVIFASMVYHGRKAKPPATGGETLADSAAIVGK